MWRFAGMCTQQLEWTQEPHINMHVYIHIYIHYFILYMYTDTYTDSYYWGCFWNTKPAVCHFQTSPITFFIIKITKSPKPLDCERRGNMAVEDTTTTWAIISSLFPKHNLHEQQIFTNRRDTNSTWERPTVSKHYFHWRASEQQFLSSLATGIRKREADCSYRTYSSTLMVPEKCLIMQCAAESHWEQIRFSVLPKDTSAYGKSQEYNCQPFG